MSSYVASFLKHNTSATIYGAETGGTEAGSNAILNHILTLPNSKVVVSIPYYHLDHQLSFPDTGKGVMPNVEMSNSKLDYLSEEDLILKQVMKDVGGEEGQ